MTSESRRIVSLVPSLTHMICDFGLKHQIVGCTKFCVEPPGLWQTAKLVGGTKDPDLDVIRGLKPTHILVNEEENKAEHIEACRGIADTFVSFPKSPHDIPFLLRHASEWLGVPEAGDQWACSLEQALEALGRDVEKGGKRWPGWGARYLYLIWREPYMAVSKDTYIEAMLGLLGMINVAPLESRYPQVTLEQIIDAHPNVIYLSSEPYPFRWRDIERLQEQIGLGVQDKATIMRPMIRKIDGQLLSWYGTMTVSGVKLLHSMSSQTDL